MARPAATAVDPVTAAPLDELLLLSGGARQLRLAPQVARARQAGQYLSRLRGRGMEFDESRPYQPGDDVRNMDWRVTARIGRPYSKLFREERERPVILSVDARPSMFFATRGRFKWARAQCAAALMAWTAFQGGDRVGGEIFSDTGHLELRPRRGRRALLGFLRALAEWPAAETGGDATSLEEPLRRLRHAVHPGSLVVLFSDFRGFDASSERQLLRIARHNDVVLFHFHDWLERELPPAGIYRLADGRGSLVVDTARREVLEAHQRRYRRRVERLESLCRGHGMTWLQCATDEEPLEVLARAFGRRRP